MGKTQRIFDVRKKVNPFTPLRMKGYFLFGFITCGMGMLYVTKEQEYARKEKQKRLLTSSEREVLDRMSDENRPPWPIVHLKVTKMREGKSDFSELQKTWDHTMYYYPADWLVPVELAQILRYNNTVYLKQYLKDPELTRKQVLKQLWNIRYNRVAVNEVINGDIQEILTTTINDLTSFSLSNEDELELQPTHGS